MQEQITKLIQRYEDKYKELEVEKTYLEDVIADLKALLAEQKKYSKRIRKICNEQRG